MALPQALPCILLQVYWMGYRARNIPGNPDSYIPLDSTLGINGTTKYTNWGVTESGRQQPAYNPGAVPPPLCLLANSSEAQNGAGGFGNWPCTFPFVFLCKTMGAWETHSVHVWQLRFWSFVDNMLAAAGSVGLHPCCTSTP
jgi:hypothetical protein